MKHRKALIVNPGGIGDQILFLPTIKFFKKYFPNLEIDLICEPRSTSIFHLTDLYRAVKAYDFKSKSKNIFELGKLFKRHKYSHFFITGSSYKSSLLAALSNATRKIGFDSGILSKIFLTDTAILNINQYASNMFCELLAPLVPEVKQIISEKDLIPEIKLSEDAVKWAKDTLSPKIKEMYYGRKIIIHPGTSKLSVEKNILKGWSPKKWAALIEKLVQDEKNIVFLIGGKDDENVISEIQKNVMFFAKPKNFFDLTSLETSIEKLAAIISYSDLLVSCDSAPMHIAVGLGKKVVAFFGPTNPKKLIPSDLRFTPVFDENLECRPCLFDKRKESCGKPVCLDVSVEKMLSAINKSLSLTKV